MSSRMTFIRLAQSGSEWRSTASPVDHRSTLAVAVCEAQLQVRAVSLTVITGWPDLSALGIGLNGGCGFPDLFEAFQVHGGDLAACELLQVPDRGAGGGQAVQVGVDQELV